MAYYYSGNVQRGSQGDDVRKWQEFLKGQGYAIDVDGVFGYMTHEMTKNWQKKNGLSVDGIVGDNTWGKAGFANINTPTSAPTNAWKPPTETNFISTNFDETTEGIEKKKAAEEALSAYEKYGDNWQYKDQYGTLFQDYLNRDPFSYDLNGDALYQQYKDKYIQQGKMAMMDTMGQASAMTGGYGSSYAQSAGQQAYQNSLDNLNDIVPQLYQMAYDRYNQEGADMQNKLGLLDADYARGYNEAKDAYTIKNSDLYDSTSVYNANRDNHNTLEQNRYTNEWNAADVARQEAWNQANFMEAQRQFEVQNRLAEEELALKKNSVSNSGSSGGNNGYKDGNTTGNPTVEPEPIRATSTQNTTNLINILKTKEEFYGRGGKDKEKYKTYEAYIESFLEKAPGQGFSEGEIAYLMAYYGLI